MPTYEYECQACGHNMEAVQRITESPLIECPACQKPRLQRLISATSFQLKGGGWYKDGYGANSGKKHRTENDRIDRLEKAIKEDKAKTTETASSGDSTAAAAPASTPSSTGSSGGSTSSE